MVLLGVGVMLASSGCASQVLITSRPPGAEVIIDEEYILGETPLVLKEQVWWVQKPGKKPTHTLTFKLEGYQTETRRLDATPRIVNIATLGVCLPFIWFMWPIGLLGQYPEDVVVQLVPEQDERAELKSEEDAAVIDFRP